MSQDHKVFIFPDSSKLFDYLLKQWLEWAQQAIEARGQFTVALSGGKTPLAFYKKLISLNDARLWPHTHIFQVDERFVPANHHENNFQMIKEHLLNHVPAQSHPIKTSKAQVAQAAAAYEKDLQHFFKQPPRFDLIILGIGEDGHTASLFPDDPSALEKNKWVVATQNHAMAERISLTLPVINQARQIIFLVTGANKAGIIRRMIMNKTTLPAAQVQPMDGQLSYVLDQAAAAKIKVEKEAK